MLDLLIGSFSRILTPLFFLGMTGATIVVMITFLHDVVDFFADDEVAATESTARKP